LKHTVLCTDELPIHMHRNIYTTIPLNDIWTNVLTVYNLPLSLSLLLLRTTTQEKIQSASTRFPYKTEYPISRNPRPPSNLIPDDLLQNLTPDPLRTRFYDFDPTPNLGRYDVTSSQHSMLKRLQTSA
jgi:hypothetical protein